MIAYLILLLAVCEAHVKILLSQTRVLYFHKGHLTTARRLGPISQVNCEGDYCEYTPDKVICDNIGIENNNIRVIWRCRPNVENKKYYLSNYSISCEDYDFKGDSMYYLEVVVFILVFIKIMITKNLYSSQILVLFYS